MSNERADKITILADPAGTWLARTRPTREATISAAKIALDETRARLRLPAALPLAGPPLTWGGTRRPRLIAGRREAYTPVPIIATSRDEAVTFGLKTYFSTESCGQGHRVVHRGTSGSIRRVDNGQCALCPPVEGAPVAGIFAAVEMPDSMVDRGACLRCVTCGTPFTPRGHGRRAPMYCSQRCNSRAAGMREKARKSAGGGG